MEPSELLERLVRELEALGLRYLVTGSTATIFYGEPRFTADIDVVVDLPTERVAELVAVFDVDEFYLDEESVRSALARRGQFNIIHPASGLKVDVVIPGGSDFDRNRFLRGRRVRPNPAYEATFASPEDVILMKLVYYRDGGSEKHLRDITGVLKISGDELDRGYLDEWAERLGVADVWRAVLERSGSSAS
jgi:hypothetical protein